jgi:hypothetical protein
MNMKVCIDGVEFRKSSFSGANHNCVGVGRRDEAILVTNTKGGQSAVSFTNDEWKAFVAGVKAGEFDLS